MPGTVPSEAPGSGPGKTGPKRGPVRGKRRLCDPFRFDQGLLNEHVTAPGSPDLRLAGADEAGRGSLAGPLVAAAVVFDYARSPFPLLKGLTDSKLLSFAAREEMYEGVLLSASYVSWSAYCPEAIDRVGLHRCNLSALTGVLESLGDGYAFAIVDGFALERRDLRARSIVGADYKSAVVAAASVVAKVVRDRLMKTLAPSYPEYGFDEHVGYATGRHQEALRRHGPCSLHRRSFQGVDTVQLGLWDE